MNDKAVDKRLSEIEDDIKLLSGYLSADIEEKMQGILGDVRMGIEGLRKTIIAIPQPAAKGEKAPQVNVGAIEASIVSLMEATERSEKSLGRLEDVVGAKDLKESGSLARHLHDVSGKLLQGIKAIDEGLKKRPASVATETGTVTVDLSELLDTVKKAEETLAASVDETREKLSQGFDTVRENVLSEVAALREAVDKGLADTGERDSLKKEMAAGQAELKKDIAATRETIAKDIDARQQLLKTSIASGNETLKKDITDSQKVVGTGIIKGIEALKSDFTTGLDALKTDITTEREILQKDITASREQTEKDLTAGQERLGKAIADGQATLKKDLAESQTSLKSDIATGQKIFQKELTDGVEKAIATNLGESLGEISGSIDKFSKEIPAATGNIMHGVTNLDRKLSGMDTEVKELIERDHGNLLQIGEYLKKLGTSEEITATRTDVGTSLEKLETLLDQLAIVYSNIKQRLELNEKLVSEGTEKNLTKQDEIKKMVMYDLNTINDTTSTLKSMCDTGSGNIGGLVAGISGQTSGMAEIVPKIMETVTKQAEQLDQVSAEVRMMRWFVIGAVGVSIVTLIASFFL